MAGYVLEELTWQQAAEIVPAKTDLAFLPVGTIEAHGSAALGTDNYIPIDLAAYLGERFNAVIAPCVHYGITKSLYGYAGSLTIRTDIFCEYILDILHSLADKKFRRCVIVNGHGGNNDALKNAAIRAFEAYGIKVAVIHWWMLCANVTEEVYGGPGGHAGRDETGYVMAIDPKLADKKRYDPRMAYIFNEGAAIFPIPGSVLVYDKAGRGEPDFDLEKGRVFAAKVRQNVGDFLADIFERWQRFFPES